jgi:hypothetical protein
MNDRKDIKMEVLKVLDEHESRNGVVKVQVVRWGKYKPVLEKREFWNDENDPDQPGKEKPGKAKGFTIEDLEKIEENMEELKKLLDKE